MDTGALIMWSATLLAVGLFGQAVAGIMRHRVAVFNWLSASYRTIQVIVRHGNLLGATLPKRLASGEIVSIGTSDIATSATRSTSPPGAPAPSWRSSRSP